MTGLSVQTGMQALRRDVNMEEAEVEDRYEMSTELTMTLAEEVMVKKHSKPARELSAVHLLLIQNGDTTDYELCKEQ